MPSREKTLKSELTGTIESFLSSKKKAQSIAEGRDEGDTDFLNIIEFIDRFNLLPQGLFPVQRFIVKLYYNVPLNSELAKDPKDRIKITDQFGQKVTRELSETEYLRYLYDQGRCNIREQDGKDRRELILVVGRRAGKCAELSTRVITSSGLLTLGELVKHREIGWKDLSIQITQEKGTRTVTNGAYYGGIQTVRDFKTYCGYSLAATPEHRIKVLSESGVIEWKYIRDIKIGDLVGINRSNNLWPEKELDVADRNDIIGSIPQIIFTSPKPIVASYLQNLFETDGILTDQNKRISLGFLSAQFAKDIQLLLLNFGIISRYISENGTIIIQDEQSRNIFLDEIGFISVDKNILLEHGISSSFSSKTRDTYYWDPVVSINERETEVADISVPEGHEYVANGMTNHNSLLSSIFAAYEMYKLLRRGNPQSYYGAPGGNEIRVLCIANDKEQASIVYGEMLGHVEAVDYFKTSLANSTQTYIKFRTEHDREKYGDTGRGSVIATFKSSIAKGLRGRGIICAILDEIAFFVDNGSSSAERVYRAIVPSIAQFSPKDPKDKHKPIGPSDGRIVLISSPDAREGFFYRTYQIAMSNSKASSNMLMIQAPTWEVNPTLSADYYEVEYHKDPRSFMTEHGAQFSDRVRGWIEDYKDLAGCLIPELKPQVRGYPREPHFCGFDLGLTNDGSSVALTRLHKGKIELAYHEVWYPKTKWEDSNPHLVAAGIPPLTPYASQLQNVTRLDLNEIGEWLYQLSKKFFISRGVFDQWTGIVLEQELHRRGLTQFEMKNFFTTHSSQAYQTFKMFMFNKQLALYDYPIPKKSENSDDISMRHSPLITELLELQATSGGKNIVIVEAPNAPGKHDDQSDALARSIMLAAEHIQLHPGVLEASLTPVAPVSRAQRMPGYYQYHRQRARLHGGSSPERRVPRSTRRS